MAKHTTLFLCMYTEKMELDSDNKLLKTGLVIVATLAISKLIFSFFTSHSRKKGHPPTLQAWPPLIGSLIRFLKGPVVMLRDEYPKLGSVFTVNLLHKKMTFLIGPEVSAHFFRAHDSVLSQQEVYKFNVPTFGPAVVFDVDYTVRQEQFRFFSEALRVNKLKAYVDMMITEAEVY
ncbi:unnamed protein product [Brassica oleracea]|nr:unnamed protein product [Brassica napus]